ncbi:type VI secretion system lipoprotein TssJ [uncultured Aquitalea sp.]|uniref:type VI secretion system lipoprotein TssJ n=1 Tax=uncultured Aquitalea sp. TaxID=540272 RepID=UPI0025D6BB56|nr:type VI secretion system lipoprotein TssJ [uncultured Aquitalea sp.]
MLTRLNKLCLNMLLKALPLLALAACGGPKLVNIAGEGSKGMNRDAQGKPLSVVVHVYQLRSADAFNRMTMDALLGGKSEGDLLGNSLISSKEVTLIPGGKLAEQETIGEETRYVGVVGFFRQPDTGYWRLLYTADAVKSDGLNFKAADCYLVPVRTKNTAIPGQSAEPPVDCSGRRR